MSVLVIIGCTLGGIIVGGVLGAVAGMLFSPPGDIGMGTTEGLILGGGLGILVGAVAGLIVGFLVA